MLLGRGNTNISDLGVVVDLKLARFRKLGAALIGLSVIAGIAWTAPAGTPAKSPVGEWLVAKKVARIKIADCDGLMWGVVAWESEPGGVDSKNPDPKLQSRPTLGMPILLGMKQSKPNQWDGSIYNSEDGHTYSANISLLDPNTLKVQGCFLGFLCGGENWTRFEATDTPGAKRPAPQQPKRKQTTAVKPGEPVDDVCSSVAGLARPTH